MAIEVPPQKKGKGRDKSARPILSTFDAIQNLCSEPIDVKVVMRGKAEVHVQCRALTPFEQEMLKLIKDEVQAPIIRGRTRDEDDKFDVTNPEYQKKKTTVDRDIRALAVFWSCLTMQESKQAQMVATASEMHLAGRRAQIIAFVKNVWTEELQDEIFNAITAQSIIPLDAVNFTSPSGQ